MNLYLLIVPLAVFAALAVWSLPMFFTVPFFNEELEVKGTFYDLTRIVSVMMTARLGERTTVVSVPRRKAKLLLKFEESGCELEFPLVTQVLRQDKAALVSFFEEYCTDVIIGEEDGLIPVIKGRMEGDVQSTADNLKSICQSVFRASEDASFKFQISAWGTDLVNLGYRSILNLPAVQPTKEFPMAATSKVDPDNVKDPRYGCLGPLAWMLLAPMPFIVTYAWFGISKACLIGLLMMIGLKAFNVNRKRANLKIDFPLLNFLVGLFGHGLTWHLKDPFYVQLIPTYFCVVGTVFAIYAWANGRTWLEYSKDEPQYSKTSERAILTFAACLGLGLGVLMNEYLRNHEGLDTWVWYFAYLRLELLLIVLAGSLPVIVLQVMGEERRE